MDDARIIQLYLMRSEAAIEETQRKFGSYLNQVAYNILRCREDSEEIVEDTYMAAWNAIPPEVPNVLKHFLSRITRNLSFSRLDYLTAKKRNSHMGILLSELDECLPDRRGSAEDMLEVKMLGQALNLFLEKLDHIDCHIFLNRYYYGRSIGEIAQMQGISERKVKYRLSLLRKKLRTQLVKEGISV